MEFDLPEETYRALPAQVIEVEGGVLLKRGRMEVRVSGEGAAEAARLVLEAAQPGATREELLAAFAGPDRASAEALVEHLISRRLLVAGDAGLEAGTESRLDVFYWHFGLRERQVRQELAGRRFLVVGVNRISRRLVRALRESGADSIRVADYPLLRNLELFDDDTLAAEAWPPDPGLPVEPVRGPAWVDPGSFDCLVAASDFGGLQLMREWNDLCVMHGLVFLPVVLQDLIGYVGPIVIPGETACFECLRRRQNAHLTDYKSRRAAEAAAFEGQALTGYLPSMASVLGDVAAVELTKLFGIGLPRARVGTLIEVNLLGSEMRARTVLKVPRCPVCSPLAERAPASLSGDAPGL